MACLVVSLGSLPVLQVPVPDGAFRIGRDTSNDLVLTLPDVADFHAQIFSSDGAASLHVNAGEAVLLNGRPQIDAALTSGDQLLLGGYRLRYVGEDEAPPEGKGTHASTGSFDSSGPLAWSDPDLRDDRVVVVGGPDLGLDHVMGTAVVVGRAPDCDLVLSDDTVSWRHLTLERAGNGIRVRDLGSRNGTFLDGRRIESALDHGAGKVRLGRTTLEMRGPTAGIPPDRARLGLAEMIGRGRAMRDVFDRIRQAAPGRLPVLLYGETGTGKELAARALHTLGPRGGAPFVPINCAALPRDMIEAELFGHAAGAFTGATADREGAFEQAAGGTIFLDEIAEMPPEVQPKLLRVLEEGQVPRIGGGRVASDFRVIAATNRDLSQEIAAGRFRTDLYYRLAVFPVRLPPLRERPEDLPDLVHAFLAAAESSTGVPGADGTRFDEDAIEPLRQYSWPGNVRELRNLILQAVVRCPGSAVPRAVVEDLLAEAPERVGVRGSLEDLEREAIRNALRDCDGRRRAAARRLGIAESTLYDKIRRYGLQD